jgi:hypothetical protein
MPANEIIKLIFDSDMSCGDIGMRRNKEMDILFLQCTYRSCPMAPAG